MIRRCMVAGAGILFLAAAVPLAMAHGEHHSSCKSGGGGELEGMFFKKAHAILENHADLELAADKVEEIGRAHV